MSDAIIRIIPTDPYCHIDRHKIREAAAYLGSKIKADKMESTSNETPLFIDCGSNLETITCPFCGKILDFDWWNKEMDAAYETAFQNLSVKLPCCGHEGSLNDLQYHFPCGFSCVVFEILNPSDSPDEETLNHVSKLLGKTVRVIYAHV